MVETPADGGTARNPDTIAAIEGLWGLTMTYFGTRKRLSARRIMKHEDTARMTIRSAPIKMWSEVGRVPGRVVTGAARSEAFTALRQGVVEGTESPPSVLYLAKRCQTRLWISLTGHPVATISITISQKVRDALPKPTRKTLDEVGRGHTAVRQPMIEGCETEYRGKLDRPASPATMSASLASSPTPPRGEGRSRNGPQGWTRRCWT